MTSAKLTADSPYKDDVSAKSDEISIDWDGADFVMPHDTRMHSDGASREGNDRDETASTSELEPEHSSDDVFALCMTTINRQASDKTAADDPEDP